MPSLTLAAFLLLQSATATAPGTEIRVVTVSFLDAKGVPVTDLGPADVALVENGTTRDVTSFSRDARPISMAILIDSSQALESGFRSQVVPAVSGFVARLPEGTRYALWTTGDRPTKIQDFTDDRAAAIRALGRIAPQGGNTLLDGVSEAASDLSKLAREGDRKVLVAVAASGPEFSHRDRYRAAEEAQRAVELVLSVQIDAGEGDFEARGSVGYVLEQLREATGGRSEVVLSLMSLDSALQKLSKALSGGYRLAYATVPELKKRRIEVHVARPETKVLLPRSTGPES